MTPEMTLEEKVELAREYAVEICQYSSKRTKALLDAVRRTGKHGRYLDDEAWLSVSGLPTSEERSAQSLKWLETVDV